MHRQMTTPVHVKQAPVKYTHMCHRFTFWTQTSVVMSKEKENPTGSVAQ